MIDNQELLFVVDENNEPLEPKPRSFVHKNGLWHRTSGIWVVNKNKQILCQKRSLKKDVKPGMWEAFFGGHLAPTEDYLQNAIEETGEELGISVKKEDFIQYKVLKSDKPTHREFQGIFAVKLNGDIGNFKFEKEEIDELKWIPIEEVRKILVVNRDKRWVKKPWDKEVLTWLMTL